MALKKIVVAAVCAALAGSLFVVVSHVARPIPRPVTVVDGPLPAVPDDEPNPRLTPDETPTPSETASEPGTSEPSSSEPSESPPPQQWPQTQTPSISSNATVVAWVSREAMVDGDTNGVDDVYVRDHRTHETELASVSSSGRLGNGRSFAPALSADGTRVAFVSLASNLVPNDTNGKADVFVRVLTQRTTIRVSVASDGTESDGDSGRFEVQPPRSYYSWLLGPSISADGRLVAFDSTADNLVDGDANGAPDVFVYNTASNETILVSVATSGRAGDGTSLSGSISLDGRRVAFDSDARDLDGEVKTAGAVDTQVFVRDLGAGTTEQASLDGDGKAPPGSSFLPKLDRTGHVVAFGTQRFGEYQTGALIVRNLDDGSFTTGSTDCHFYGVSISADVSIVVRDGDFGCLDPMVFMNVEPRVLGAGGDSEVSPDGRYVIFDAGLDPYSVDYQEYGGDFGAMVYDRETERFTAAYKW